MRQIHSKPQCCTPGIRGLASRKDKRNWTVTNRVRMGTMCKTSTQHDAKTPPAMLVRRPCDTHPGESQLMQNATPMRITAHASAKPTQETMSFPNNVDKTLMLQHSPHCKRITNYCLQLIANPKQICMAGKHAKFLMLIHQNAHSLVCQHGSRGRKNSASRCLQQTTHSAKQNLIQIYQYYPAPLLSVEPPALKQYVF